MVNKEIVEKIRRLHKEEGLVYSVLAKRFNLDSRLIRKIINREGAYKDGM